MSQSQSEIESVLHEERRFEPSAEFRAQSRLGDEATWQRMHQESIDSPETFWDGVARGLPWIEPYGKVLDWSGAPFAKWFVGGKLNASAVCLDQHLAVPAVPDLDDARQRLQFGLVHLDGQRRLSQRFNVFAILHDSLPGLAAVRRDRSAVPEIIPACDAAGRSHCALPGTLCPCRQRRGNGRRASCNTGGSRCAVQAACQRKACPAPERRTVPRCSR